MALPKASLDASFWINAHQVGLTSFLPEYFQLFVCSEVEREILHPLITKGLPVAAALQFQEWCETKIITRQEPAHPVVGITWARTRPLLWLLMVTMCC